MQFKIFYFALLAIFAVNYTNSNVTGGMRPAA